LNKIVLVLARAELNTNLVGTICGRIHIAVVECFVALVATPPEDIEPHEVIAIRAIALGPGA
jgi:hypothetical protein